MKIRNKIMGALLLAFAIVTLAFIWNDYRLRELQIGDSLTKVASTVEKLIASEIRADVQVMETALDSLTRNPDLQSALRGSRRDRLSAMVTESFTRLKSKNQISHFYFHRLDRTNLLRMHEPHHFDDKIERQTLKQAETTGEASSGVEQGPTGASVLRVVYPVNQAGQRVGYMELGKEFQDIVHKIETLMGLKALLIVDKALIQREKWEKRNNKSKFATTWDFLPGHAIMASTLEQIPMELKDIHLASDRPSGYVQDSMTISHGNSVYRVITVPYLSEAGRKMADIVLLYDSASLLSDFHRASTVTLSVALLALVLLSLFFNIYIIRIEKLMSHQQATVVHNSRMASIGEMAAGMAHEINTPLNAILLNAQIIQMKTEEDASKEIGKRAGSIVDIGNRIAKIINGLKGFSRESSPGSLGLVFTARQCIDTTLDLCSERLRNKGVILKVGTVPEIEIQGQMIQFSQVMLNLVNNSFDAVQGTENPWISIDAQLGDLGAEISVTDSGNGIPAEIVKKMFQPFFTTKDIGQGTGFGLSISKGLIESYGGKLIYDSNCRNTRLVMRFPVRNNKGVAV